MKIYKFSALRSICQRSLFVIFILMMIPLIIFSQEKNANFMVDFSRFRFQGDAVYIEIYYSLDRDGLTYQKQQDGYQAGGLIQTYVKKGTKGMLVDSLVITDVVKTMNEILPSQKFAEQSNIQLEPGDYELVSRLTDLVSQKSVMFTSALKIQSFSTEELTLSDIQLANSIRKQANRENKFDKNGLRIIPNASKTYGTGLEQLSFYAEVYNLKYDGEASNSTYHSNYYIVDQQGKIIKEISGRSRTKPGASSIINGSFDMADIPSGFYSFKIVVTDEFTGQAIEAAKDFQIFRQGDFLARRAQVEPTLVTQIAPDEFATMPEPALNEYFEKIIYITLKEEQKIFKKLDVTGKKEFLKNFWKSRDPQPVTSINERKEEYFRLIEYANANFSVGGKQGWKTDQGRVLLVYGKPDDIERFPSDSDTKAYQVWHYQSIEGGVVFVFVDIMSIRDFRLVHSTHRSEVQEPEWQQRYLKY
ncbi:GWxTD domain-containing protein [candidate division KSB1 bacterium]|nr:GWxTD domain-containing protein [candidate division KSB1 bacterium]